MFTKKILRIPGRLMVGAGQIVTRAVDGIPDLEGKQHTRLTHSYMNGISSNS